VGIGEARIVFSLSSGAVNDELLLNRSNSLRSAQLVLLSRALRALEPPYFRKK
jgi:hypothetical protein